MLLFDWSRFTFYFCLASIVLFLLMGCWGRAEESGGKTQGNQEASVEEVIERLARVEAKLHGFRVRCLSRAKERYSKVDAFGEEPERRVGDVSGSRVIRAVWNYRDDGSSRFESNRVQYVVTTDGSRQATKFSAYSVFDGPRGRGKYLWLNSPDSDVRVSGDEEKYVSTPRHLQS
ncbi:MAG: hypothetical protein ABI557_15120, partial [Aureliella sp.]